MCGRKQNARKQELLAKWRIPYKRRIAKKVMHVFKRLKKKAKAAASKSFGVLVNFEVLYSL